MFLFKLIIHKKKAVIIHFFSCTSHACPTLHSHVQKNAD